MRVAAPWGTLIALVLLGLPGCANNTSALQTQVATLQTQVATLTTRNQDLQGRTGTLDTDNQDLETVLAQTRQQRQLYEDQVVALRDQLTSTASQLAKLNQEKQGLEQQNQALTVATKKKIGASVTANNSLRENLPAINIPGVDIRQDGDVVRIELPADRLFEPGTARFRPGAGQLIDNIAAEVSQAYPAQMIGIEGHNDNEPPPSPWSTPHQFSLGRAMAVFDYLTSRGQFRANQLFVVGHGANHPIVSNATPAGKARNRRVELVVYPERFGQ